MGLFTRGDDHHGSQQHLSHNVEGNLGARARRRLGRHAADCINCGLGIRAMRALVRLIPGIEGSEIIRAPAGIFDRVRSAGVGGAHCDLSSAPGDV
jgi:hypothetical protein